MGVCFIHDNASATRRFMRLKKLGSMVLILHHIEKPVHPTKTWGRGLDPAQGPNSTR